MKKALAVLLSLFLLSAVAFGCQGSQKADEVITIKYAHNQREDSPQHAGAAAFKEKIEELSGGRMKVDIYPNGQLGSLRELIESTQGGDIEMTQQPTSMIGNFVPQAMITDLPWLFESEPHMWAAMNGEAGKLIDDLMYSVGLVNLGYMHGGAKVFTTKNTPIKALEDFVGLQMRAMPTQIVLDTYKALGANPVPIEFSELYNAMQQGVVDGQENPNQTCYMNNYHEVQKYTITTEHAYMIYANVVNKDFYEKLPQDLQGYLAQAMEFAREKEREVINSEEAMYIEACEQGGMEFITLSDEAIAQMKAATLSVWDANREALGAEFYDAFIAAAKNAQ